MILETAQSSSNWRQPLPGGCLQALSLGVLFCGLLRYEYVKDLKREQKEDCELAEVARELEVSFLRVARSNENQKQKMDRSV